MHPFHLLLLLPTFSFTIASPTLDDSSLFGLSPSNWIDQVSSDTDQLGAPILENSFPPTVDSLPIAIEQGNTRTYPSTGVEIASQKLPDSSNALIPVLDGLAAPGSTVQGDGPSNSNSLVDGSGFLMAAQTHKKSGMGCERKRGLAGRAHEQCHEEPECDEYGRAKYCCKGVRSSRLDTTQHDCIKCNSFNHFSPPSLLGLLWDHSPKGNRPWSQLPTH